MKHELIDNHFLSYGKLNGILLWEKINFKNTMFFNFLTRSNKYKGSMNNFFFSHICTSLVSHNKYLIHLNFGK